MRDEATPNPEYDLQVRVPNLNNYTVLLVTVNHTILLYPATVYSRWKSEKAYEANSPEELDAVVMELLGSAEVQRVVASLYAQAGGG